MSTDSQVLWKGPPLCRRMPWHLFCSLAVHGGLCWESSVCISSLAPCHGILTVGCRQGCLMQRFHGEKKELTRRQDEKLRSATLSVFAREVKQRVGRKLINVRVISRFTEEQSCERVPDIKHVWNVSIFLILPLAMQRLPLIPSVFMRHQHMEEIWFSSPGNRVENFICQDDFSSQTFLCSVHRT